MSIVVVICGVISLVVVAMACFCEIAVAVSSNTLGSVEGIGTTKGIGSCLCFVLGSIGCSKSGIVKAFCLSLRFSFVGALRKVSGEGGETMGGCVFIRGKTTGIVGKLGRENGFVEAIAKEKVFPPTYGLVGAPKNVRGEGG